MSRRSKHNMPTEVIAASPNGSASQPALFANSSQPASIRSEIYSIDPIFKRALKSTAEGHYEKAIGILATGKSTPEILNARGVCLLRMGRIEDAIRLFRGLVLSPGNTWARPEVPTLYKLNFATALLLSGSPSGCLSLLGDINEPAHPGVIRLQTALSQWAATLTFWQRLNWWFGRVEPTPCQPSIDFPAGDFSEADFDSASFPAAAINGQPVTEGQLS